MTTQSLIQQQPLHQAQPSLVGSQPIYYAATSNQSPPQSGYPQAFWPQQQTGMSMSTAPQVAQPLVFQQTPATTAPTAAVANASYCVASANQPYIFQSNTGQTPPHQVQVQQPGNFNLSAQQHQTTPNETAPFTPASVQTPSHHLLNLQNQNSSNNLHALHQQLSTEASQADNGSGAAPKFAQHPQNQQSQQQQQQLVYTQMPPQPVYYIAATQPSSHQSYLQYAQQLPHGITSQGGMPPSSLQQQQTWMQAPPIMSWKQRKMAMGRSDRLRRLADELARKDSEAPTMPFSSVNMPDFCLVQNDKDNNTSASETSKSHQADINHHHYDNRQFVNTYLHHQTKTSQFRRPKNNHLNGQEQDLLQHAYLDVPNDEDDHQNQTVSELLSMLSNSGESGQAQQPKDQQLTTMIGDLDTPAAANGIKSGVQQFTSTNDEAQGSPAPPIAFSDYIMQDKAIQEIKTWDKTNVIAAASVSNDGGFFDGFHKSRGLTNTQQQPSSSSQAKGGAGKGQDSPLILAADEAYDQMIYYDKSSCMHAPKANQVPIL